MPKTIELIDKYIVTQAVDGEYNPPSYIWTDNTGELIRCGECKHCYKLDILEHEEMLCHIIDTERTITEDDYCSWAERRGE